MKALGPLLLLALPLCAQETLAPREGSGWSGFGAGTSVRIKRTFIGKGRVPSVTITRMELKSVGKQRLTIDSLAKNALGIEIKTSLKLPVSGEAGENETAKYGTLPAETVFACGRKFSCERVTANVTGAKGTRRAIVKWFSSKPRMLVKRTEERRNAAGKLTERLSMLLTRLPAKRMVAGRKVISLTYSTQLDAGKIRNRATAVVSRDVPGYEVRVDAEVTQAGKVIQTIRVEVLGFETK